ncbi:MAG: petC [Moraxellaceae bacterium]|jgi:ubiquinol-cytochrome c reductase cytochrome c1 subunit|nr:petC [Moraxellaceae bacterium]
MKKLFLFVFLALAPLSAQAAGGSECGELKECLHAPVNYQDKASLQNGAKLYLSYCLGCHSAKFMRYERMGADLGIDKELVQQYMNFTSDKSGDQITTNVSAKDQAKWFGAPPPDLTLETRLRSPNWVYSYLLNFYPDEARPYGVNNKVFKDVAMPHVLADLEQDLKPEEYKQAVGDIVNFMAYLAEPNRAQREHIGVFVLFFLFILLVPVWFLNREYWKDIK